MALYWRGIIRSELEMEFYNDVSALLQDSPYSWYVTEGYREMKRSNELYLDYVLNKGPRAAPGGKSAHNYGMAIDVALDINELKAGLQPSWNTKMAGWLWLKKETAKHPRLKGGWRFGDWPHIEKYKWLDYVPWRKNYEDNQRYLKEVIAAELAKRRHIG